VSRSRSEEPAEGPRGRVEQAVRALQRPLAFAARDDFAHVARVGNLAAAVVNACRTLRELSIPSDLRRFAEELEQDFSNELEPGALPGKVSAALERLAPLDDSEWMEACLERPTSALPSVGPKRSATLARRGLHSVRDLLFRLPVDYEDRRALSRIGELAVGQRATFLAELLLVDFVSSKARGRFRRVLQAVVADGTGNINLKWFRSVDTIASGLHKGDWLLVTGDVKRFRFAKEIVHPEIERVDGPGTDAAPGDEAGRSADEAADTALRQVVPRYAGLESINPRTLRRFVRLAVDEYADLVGGHLPPALVEQHGLPDVPSALRTLHAPSPEAAGAEVDVEAYRAFASPAHRRLILEELYLLELGLALRRQAQGGAPALPIDCRSERVRAAPAALPFELTGGQQRAWQEIAADLSLPHPMNRLVQGDVGSGKTAVALLAAVAVAASGAQVALMAPTELLAEQHERTLRRLAAGAGSPLALRIGLLTASRPAAEAQAVKQALAAGELDLVVGTHALVQGDVEFANLALAVVDEQHRFGVRQRAALAQQGRDGLHPHVLVMTATPIPRTLALTLYGDLDHSVIDELPPGRSPVTTLLLREGEGARITGLVRAAVGRGEQVYVVYPLVEESEKVDLRSAMESTERIRAAFPEAHVDLVHGRLSAGERTAVMRRFERGETQILVTTTVVEVGVDVAAATLMVIEHAERFGLAQLHQLRGRVGRDERPGTCLLVSRGGSEKAEARLRAMLDSTDGFEIAEADLEIRGPGDFLGTRQSGHLPDLRVAELLRDVRLVAVARQTALEKVRADPGLAGSPVLRRAVEAHWGDRLALVDVG
jgi:ATP-dependent DNA helicase RecG